MDTITHIALGACIGEVMLAKPLGKKALIWGALAQSFPDIDFIGSFWIPPAEYLSVHRGFTHSIFAGILAALLFSFLADRIHRPHNISFKKFLLFFLIQILLHDLLDTCNAYGTGLFEPFFHRRFSLNILYVADPLFSISLGIAAFILLTSKKNRESQKNIALAGIIPAFAYFIFCVFNKISVSDKFKTALSDQKIQYKSYFTSPTPFNGLLWYCVAKADSGYYITYRSVLDKTNSPVNFSFYPQNKLLLADVKTTKNIKDLLHFANGYYTLEQKGDTMIFNILRFGQILGWQKANAPFTFHYYLNDAYDNTLVVQRGRFEGWNSSSISFYIDRMLGKTNNY